MKPIAEVRKINGARPWRVTDSHGKPLTCGNGRPVDRGGYERPLPAQNHAQAINHSMAVQVAKLASAKITKRQRIESRRAMKRAQREAAERATKKVAGDA